MNNQVVLGEVSWIGTDPNRSDPKTVPWGLFTLTFWCTGTYNEWAPGCQYVVHGIQRPKFVQLRFHYELRRSGAIVSCSDPGGEIVFNGWVYAPSEWLNMVLADYYFEITQPRTTTLRLDFRGHAIATDHPPSRINIQIQHPDQ